MSVKSVYNFVPAPKEDEVFKPDWADKVSHDIPFEDGESGEIELEITAKTPIFIRNGHTKKDAKNNTKRYQEFSNVVRNGKKEYFIPGSSLKGMFRNVLEIMSLSRMKQISDNRYSFRDLTRNSLYMKSYKSNDVKGGWLMQDEQDNWRIEECEEIAFINHKELEKKGIPFRDLFLNKQPKEKIAEYKYKLVDDKLLDAKFSTYVKELFGNVTRQMARYDDEGRKGTLVFTGQSSKRKEYKDKNGNLKASGKIHEFVFFNAKNPNILHIGKKMQKDFKFTYLDHDKQNISKDWRFWKNKLEKGERIPVFFTKNETNEVKHFGLSYMYKLPYEHSIQETLPYSEYNLKRKDMAELIFGSINNEDSSLKGRVYVSHAFSRNAVEDDDLEKEILASPKASYYPYYLNQPKNARGYFYYTYMDDDAVLKGYKRYPIQQMIRREKYDDKQLKNDNVFSEFKPLKEGTSFICKVRFHNLKKAEIGALVSSITFHGNEGKSFHNIGGAKPFGYGKLSISRVKLKNLKFDIDDYLSSYEDLMGGEEWLNSTFLIELLAMAQYSNDSLIYPSDPKEFVEMKNDNKYLTNYSQILSDNSINISITSISKKNKILKDIDNFDFASDTLKNLKASIKDLGLITIPENLHDKLYNALKEIILNHKASRVKLTKKGFEGYEWQNTITTWVSKDTAQRWFNQLIKNQ
jgi:CRISPR-associated protein (TIGR03986 family)